MAILSGGPFDGEEVGSGTAEKWFMHDQWIADRIHIYSFDRIKSSQRHSQVLSYEGHKVATKPGVIL